MNFPNCTLNIHEALTKQTDWYLYFKRLTDRQLVECDDALCRELANEGAYREELRSLRDTVWRLQSIRFRSLVDRAETAERELAKAKRQSILRAALQASRGDHS